MCLFAFSQPPPAIADPSVFAAFVSAAFPSCHRLMVATHSTSFAECEADAGLTVSVSTLLCASRTKGDLVKNSKVQLVTRNGGDLQLRGSQREVIQV